MVLRDSPLTGYALATAGAMSQALSAPDARRPAFLTAEWRHLAMLNWRVPPDVLSPLVPSGTMLDSWDGGHYVSLVGFLFLGTRVLGIPIPFHGDFEEINLRFYVRRTVGSEVRRGVCFVREIVPRAAIAWTARLAYNEPYITAPMTHRVEPAVRSQHPDLVEYAWRMGRHWSRIGGRPIGQAASLVPGSHEEFVTEHYWGYTRQRDGGTIEYRVAHVPWQVRRIPTPVVEGELVYTYGQVFGRLLERPPDTALLATGSSVTVYLPSRLDDHSRQD